MSDSIERLVGVLRQPAVPAELEGESIAIGTMVSAVRPGTVGPVDIRAGRARRMRVASFVAAGVIGFGTVAAAGPGSFADSSLETIADDAVTSPSDSSTAPDGSTTSTTTTEAPAPDALATPSGVPGDESPPDELVDDPDTEFDETQCAEGNHGRTVSSVARTPGRTSDDVRAAAHSSCGKKDKDKDESESESVDDEADDKDKDNGKDKDKDNGKDKDKDNGKDKESDESESDTEADQSESDGDSHGEPDQAGSGPGNGNGNGNGNGKGKGKDKND